MKKLIIYLLLLGPVIVNQKSFANDKDKQQLNSQEQQSISFHMDILRKFKSMYENKFFDKKLFDIENGYLQTSLSIEDKMPLNFFVEYNNMWWFSIIDRVIVPAIAFDYENNAGFIALEIYYDKTLILRGTQLIKFKEDKINYIRTYASHDFFLANDPLVKLDNYGNQIWLTTGYDLNYSSKAALLFFESPMGKSFSANAKTKTSVEKIQKNLKNFLQTKYTPRD